MRRNDGDWLDEKERRERVSADRSTNYDPLLDTILWREAVNAAVGARRAYPGNMLTVRYEDLAADPETTIRRICNFAGLLFRPEMLDIGWINSATQAKEGNRASQSGKNADTVSGGTVNGVRTAAVEKWRAVLSPEEIYLCQRLVGKEMGQLGYRFVAVPLAARVKAVALLGHSANHFYTRVRGHRPMQIALRARETSRRMARRALKNLGL
jgi:hypothetical protein